MTESLLICINIYYYDIFRYDINLLGTKVSRIRRVSLHGNVNTPTVSISITAYLFFRITTNL